MKFVYRCLCAVMCLFASLNLVHAQWIQTNGPYGNSIYCFAVSGTNLFAGAYEGVYRSTNNGTSWTAVNAGLRHGYVYALAASGSNLFAAVESLGESGGVFLSTDMGASWAPANAGLPANTFIYTLTAGDSNIFAGTDKGVFQYRHNSAQWTAVITSVPDDVLSLAVSGTHLMAGMRNGAIIRSTNYGATWTSVDIGLSAECSVNSIAISGSTIFVGTSGGVYRSTDNGTTWNPAYAGLPDSAAGKIVVTGSYLFANTANGVFRSSNNGISWTAVNAGLIPNSMGATTLAVCGTDLFAGTMNAGIFRSTDNGESWTQANAGLTGTPESASCFAVAGANLFAGTFTGGVYRSTNNGETWTSGDTWFGVGALAMNDAYLFAGASYGIGGFPLFPVRWGIFRSADSSATWTQVTAGMPPAPWVNALAVCGTTDFAGMTEDGVYRSTDNGTTWSAANTGMASHYVLSLAVSGTTIFAGTSGFSGVGGVRRSTDNGTSWTTVNSGLPAYSYVYALAVSGTDLFAGIISYDENTSGVFLSTNMGESWSRVSTGLPAQSGALAVSGSAIFAGVGIPGDNGGIFYSADNGASWTAVNTGLPASSFVSALAVSGSYLYAGTWTGTWKRPLTEMVTGVENFTTDVPTQFQLEQNYPNPFNPTTTIAYQLPTAGTVSLAVYDVLGREVARLVNEMKQPGSYNALWDASSFPSGMYFYRLVAGGFVQTKRLVILK